MEINLLHWNPHWECFTNQCCVTAESCPGAVVGTLNKLLGEQKIDFASMVMFEVKDYTPPWPFRVINPYPSGQCGLDTTSIIYNQNKWNIGDTMHYFCLKPKDRMTIIQKFTSVKSPVITVFVVAAHFGHDSKNQFDPDELTYLSTYLKNNSEGPKITDTDNVIFMADTNAAGTTGIESNENILRTVLGNNKATVNGSVPFKTCCYNDYVDEKWAPFSYSSDRILANFGNKMVTYTPPENQQAQEWANSINIPPSCYAQKCDKSPTIGEMHKFVRCTLQL